MIKKVYLYIKNSMEKELCLAEIIPGIRTKYRNSVNQNVLKSEKGWILFDSLLGIIFLSTAIIALLLTFTQATKVNTAATNRVQATYLAQQVLEDLKAQDGSAKIVPEPTHTLDITNSIYKIPYTISTEEILPDTVKNAPEPPLKESLKTYRVTVSWSDSTGGSANKKVEMTGYYYVK